MVTSSSLGKSCYPYLLGEEEAQNSPQTCKQWHKTSQTCFAISGVLINTYLWPAKLSPGIFFFSSLTVRGDLCDNVSCTTGI